ncbi:hypothetical protein XHV734_4223 [Xanthomonas hortorum pv. vitians]|nr:hypothetical protein XHV734_4223 [Xanthomonas hortorum pv. vitians]
MLGGFMEMFNLRMYWGATFLQNGKGFYDFLLKFLTPVRSWRFDSLIG